MDLREARREEEPIEHKKNGRRPAAAEKQQSYLTILYTLDRDKQGEFTKRISIPKEWELRPLTVGRIALGGDRVLCRWCLRLVRARRVGSATRQSGEGEDPTQELQSARRHYEERIPRLEEDGGQMARQDS